jgi:glycosyltransferase involved in cell wall biosynthesis
MKNLVSVIVPCYNQAQFLDEALQSVLEQTYAHWECIIVNDGSPDHTEVIAQEWLAKDTRFKYVYKENGGLCNARNAGISIAKGEFILTLDADDKYEPTFIEKALNVMENNSGVGVVSSWILRFQEDKEICAIKPKGAILEDFLYSNAANGTSLFRKKCWEEVGGYDENMKKGYEDWEFYIRVCKLGWTIHIIEEVLFFYRQHPISMRTVAIKSYDTEIKTYIFRKHELLYKEHYDTLIENFMYIIDFEKKERAKIYTKIDFRIGAAILKPFRIIKSLFK